MVHAAAFPVPTGWLAIDTVYVELAIVAAVTETDDSGGDAAERLLPGACPMAGVSTPLKVWLAEAALSVSLLGFWPVLEPPRPSDD